MPIIFSLPGDWWPCFVPASSLRYIARLQSVVTQLRESKGIQDALNFYKAWTGFLQQEFGSQKAPEGSCMPILEHLRTKGNTSVYEYQTVRNHPSPLHRDMYI